MSIDQQLINLDAKVAIVILNWNGWQDTIGCLESVSNLNSSNFSVVVVDNASTDNSRDKLLAWGKKNIGLNFSGVIEEQVIDITTNNLSHKEWIYIQSSINGGFAKGNNLGIKLALNMGCEYVWLLNNDTVVASEALNALLSRIGNSRDIGMCGSVLRFFDDKDIVQAVGGVDFNFLQARGGQLGQGLSSNDPHIIKLAEKSPTYIAGASLLLSASFLQDVGLMEESYFLYFEEIDWALRARPKWKTAVALESIVFHKEGGSIGTASRGKRSILSQYYLYRNLIRFYMLRRFWLLPFAMFNVIKEMIKLVIKRDWPLAKITSIAFLDGLLIKSGPKAL